MKTMLNGSRWVRHGALAALVLMLAGPTVPLMAQDNVAELRLRKLEAEVRALQRTVFPGGDGKFFPAQIPSGQPATTPAGTPSTTPVTDILQRMEALEAQIARLTSQTEVNTNKISQLEARLAALAPVPAPTATAAPAPTPLASATATPRPAPTASSTARPTASAPPRPAASAVPSAQRLAAVRAIEKPQTSDAGDDEYSYGFRLWEAKFYPEAQQQLKLFLNKYPRHSRLSYARNLLGRAYLDEGNPREAASWFLQNYNANKNGERAPDSVLFLAESMKRLNDAKRACVALQQFADEYPAEAAGRLKAQHDRTRSGLTCN